MRWHSDSRPTFVFGELWLNYSDLFQQHDVMLKISQLSCFITNNSPSYRENESNQKLDITQFSGYFANLVLFYTFIMEENTKYLEYSSVQSGLLWIESMIHWEKVSGKKIVNLFLVVPGVDVVWPKYFKFLTANIPYWHPPRSISVYWEDWMNILECYKLQVWSPGQ